MLDDSDNLEPKKEPESPDMNGQTKLDDMDDSPPSQTAGSQHHHGMFTELQKPSTGGLPSNSMANLPPGLGLPPQSQTLNSNPQGPGGVGVHPHTSSPHDVGGILSDYQNL